MSRIKWHGLSVAENVCERKKNTGDTLHENNENATNNSLGADTHSCSVATNEKFITILQMVSRSCAIRLSPDVAQLHQSDRSSAKRISLKASLSTFGFALVGHVWCGFIWANQQIRSHKLKPNWENERAIEGERAGRRRIERASKQ